ncbi:MAG: hypothetical protein EXS63_09170 [Candidatus Omnitrophica bacterium]|nr:hypothetical protein [Candidatus Omnitrophota bacterium]
MRDIKFRVWYLPEKKMYYRGYQKLTHILLCEDDQGKEQGSGTPVWHAPYQDCEMLECTDIEDLKGRLIFEGDIVRAVWNGKSFLGEAGPVPDMFKSRSLHPLHSLFERFGIPDDAKDLTLEILGNRYEHPLMIKRLEEIHRHGG